MASKYDGPLDKNTDFTHAGPNGEPASGLSVQNYIKSIDAKKVGSGFTLEDGSAHLLFADAGDLEIWKADRTRTDLIIDRIALEPAYSISIDLISPTYVPVFAGTTGNTIDYTFTTINKSGTQINESITATYTISRGSASKVITETYKARTTVHFNVDKYLLDGINDIDIQIVGQTTGVSAMTSVRYQVIGLILTDSMNISTVYRTNAGDESVQIPYTVSGVGQKIMEWYIDGVRVPINRDEDEINDNSASRTKYINIIGLEQGKHSLQFRVGINVGGEIFYSGIHYREFIVSLGQSGNPIIVTATEFPVGSPILGPADALVISPTQYEPFPLRLAVYNPNGTYQNTTTVSVDENVVASVVCSEGQESRVSLTLTEVGQGVLTLSVDSFDREIALDVEETTLDIHEITGDLEMNFTAEGKSNSSSDKDTWTDGTNSANLVGFEWTNVSGWVNNTLIIPSRAHIDFDLAPLAVNPALEGKTIELEFRTINVDDDNATLINLINSTTGAGIKLTATEIFVKSMGGLDLNRRYKTDEDLRISIVINRRSGSTLNKLVSVYFNGILSMTQNFAETDQFTAPNLLSVGGIDAGIILRQIRIYNTALDSDSIVNNFILYRPTVDEMLAVYERNDLYEQGVSRFDLDKIAAYLPVMIITGDLTPIETATDNKATTVVDVEYTNLQNPSYNFKMVNAQMRPQGTSSLTYPRKNLRLYTKKRDDTIVYDANGNVVANKLYSFKPGAQPVECWTLKADFAESSSTHNTGVARIWNNVMKQAQVGGQYVLRTEAQQAAIDNGYPYDVRTTVDGFPIVIFHRRTIDDPLTFLGKYNFNNDKSTESVFGFRDIPGFDNTNVKCWEFRDSGFDLALFKTPQSGRTYAQEFDYYASDYNNLFKQVWESRYPDTDTPNYDSLRRLAVWINSTEHNLQKWIDEKEDYFDLPKLAAYYIYLMRFGAVDQTVKNAMITTEDGLHWYFINYDNDTILGVRNDGLLKFGPEIDRQSPDPELGGYAYAGHSSVLWNNFEADSECMDVVRTIDSALFTAGLTYNNMIEMFNEEQAGKWAENVYNKDAMYKYIEPYLYQDKNYLGSLQGSRSDHRKWWISNRFSLYDAIYANDAYNNTAITMIIPNARIGDHFSIVAGKDFYYGWGQNRQPMVTGVYIERDEPHQFDLTMNFEIGTPLRIYAPHYIQTLDLSGLIEFIGSTNFNLAPAWSETLGSKMKRLILGVDNPLTDLRRNTALNSPSGLANILTLEELNVAGYEALTSLDLRTLVNLKTFKGKASGLTSVQFANGAPLTTIELPAGMQALVLDSIPNLQLSGLDIEGNWENISNINIRNCPKLSNNSTVITNWLDNKVTEDSECSFYMDNVNWENISDADLIKVCNFKNNGGNLTLIGRASIESIGSQEFAEFLIDTFGPNVFNPASSFYIQAPPAVYLVGPTELLQGESAQYTGVIIGGESGGTSIYQIYSGGTANESLDTTTGYLTTIEPSSPPSTHSITLRYAYIVGGHAYYGYLTVQITQRVYPTSNQVNLTGPNEIKIGIPNTYNIGYTVEGINGDMTAVWEITGDMAAKASIVTSDVTKCVIALNGDPQEAAVSGNITVTLKKTKYPSTILATKSITFGYQDDTVAVSRALNPYVMDVLVENNLINPALGDTNDKMTKVSASLITSSQFQPGTYSSTSIFAKNNNFRQNCKNFDELQWFTGVTTLGKYLFNDCNLEHVVLSNSVQQIGEYCFTHCKLSDITLPEGLELIDTYAFYNITTLQSITIPSTVTQINNTAFASCSNLTTLTLAPRINTPLNIEYNAFGNTNIEGELILPNVQIRLGDGAFQYTKLSSVYLPSTVTYLGYYAFSNISTLTNVTINCSIPAYCFTPTNGNGTFYNCPNLSSIIIGEGVITIGEQAFKNCTIITGDLVLPSTVTSIKSNAFEGCTNLTSIEFPVSLTSLSTSPFKNCTGLTSITFNGNVVWSQLFDNNYSSGYNVFSGCSNITSLIFGENCESIYSNAFSGASQITNVEFSEGLTTIGNSAFSMCSLSSVEFPASVTTIGTNAFSNNNEITTVIFNGNVPNDVLNVYVNSSSYYNRGAFYFCPNIDTVIINEGCQIIGNQAFEYLTIESITLPSTITQIGTYAFQGSYITSIIIPDGVTSISNYTFERCQYLQSVTLSQNLTEIGQYAFGSCTSLKSIDIPISVDTIGKSAFYNCSDLTTISIPFTTSMMIWSNGSIFERCNNIKNVTIKEGCTSIESSCFYQHPSIETINIPSTITSIGGSAFFQCTNLKSINIPAACSVIGNSAFGYCSGLTSIVVDPENTAYSDGRANNGSNCLVQKSNNTLIKGCDNSIIPNNIVGIADSAFVNCKNLTTITIPASCTTINQNPFMGCSKLASITVNPGNTIFGDRSSNCIIRNSNNAVITGCKNSTLSNGIQAISNYAFDGASELTTITIPNTVTRIYSGAFRNTGLRSIEIPTSIVELESDVFLNCTNLQTVTLHEGLLRIYSTFSGCTSLSNITIPSTVTLIYNSCFSGCSSLRSINIPDGVTQIYSGTFYNCSSLESINIHKYITRIDGAFNGCSSLNQITVSSENQNYSDLNGSNCIFDVSNNTIIVGCISTIIPTNTAIAIGGNAFDGKGITSITIPSNVTSIANYAFKDCLNLTSVTINCDIPQSCFGNNAYIFYNCSNLSSVIIGEGCQTISSYAFNGAPWLTSIILPTTVTSLGANAFNSCQNLETVTSKPVVPPSYGSNALPGISIVRHMYVPSSSVSVYQNASGWITYAGIIEAIQ